MNSGQERGADVQGKALRWGRRAAAAIRDVSFPRWAIVGFELARGLGKELPSRDSTPLQAVLQTIGSIDVVRTILWPAKGNPVAQYAERYGLVEHKSEPFVRLFFETEDYIREYVRELEMAESIDEVIAAIRQRKVLLEKASKGTASAVAAELIKGELLKTEAPTP